LTKIFSNIFSFMHKNSLQAAQREQTGKLSCRINNIDKSPNILNDADHQIICIYSKLPNRSMSTKIVVYVWYCSCVNHILSASISALKSWWLYHMPQPYGINTPVYVAMTDKSQVEFKLLINTIHQQYCRFKNKIYMLKPNFFFALIISQDLR
jgi:hypothetical protein